MQNSAIIPRNPMATQILVREAVLLGQLLMRVFLWASALALAAVEICIFGNEHVVLRVLLAFACIPLVYGADAWSGAFGLGLRFKDSR